METRFDTIIETYGLDPKDFTFERYRANDENLSSPGRGCRVTHVPSGQTASSAVAHTAYPVNASRAVDFVVASLLPDDPSVQIDELLHKYEEEECDFEDLDWVANAALRIVETMPDSQARCLLYVLARHAKKDPYRKAPNLKHPVDNVRVVGDLLRYHKEDFVKMAKEEFEIEMKLLSTVRRSTIKAGTVDKLYGKMTLTGKDAHNKFKDIKNRITAQLAEFGTLEQRPVIYTTSAGQTVKGYQATFRVVCGGEDDYEQWARHGWV